MKNVKLVPARPGAEKYYCPKCSGRAYSRTASCPSHAKCAWCGRQWRLSKVLMDASELQTVENRILPTSKDSPRAGWLYTLAALVTIAFGAAAVYSWMMEAVI